MTESKKQDCPVMITEADAYLFAQGTHYEIYEKMGAHEVEIDGQKGVYFAVWAPNAKYVNVIGSFNNWDIFQDNMDRISEGGIFALFIPGAKIGDMYKYVITTSDDRKLYKADPYGNYAQLRPDNASIVTDLSGFKWTDSVWQTEKQTKDILKQPMAIYECHIGSWMKHPVSDPEKETGFYNVRIFNEYNYGSYLLYRGIPVFIDSRADLYAPEFSGKQDDIFMDFIETSNISKFYEDTFEKYKITHVITYKNSKMNMIITKTNDKKYKELADRNIESFLHRVENRIELDHHDLGFLYSLSCVSGYKLTKNEHAKKAALLAADKLMERWQEKGQFLQAWGPKDSPEHYRFIIDCMLNIPLLYWASEVTGDNHYADAATKHFTTSCKYVIRDDASAYHTFYMDPVTGGPSHGATRQGYSDDSSWARGQAWGIYGIPLNIRYTKNTEYVDLYKGMANYFLNRLPEDNICYWDLIFTDDPEQSRDSSAAAIAVCGMLEMDQWLKEEDPSKKVYQKACDNITRSLIQNYTNNDHKPGDPILYHGVYSWHSGKGVDEGNIWGDYYYMEALMRQIKQWDPYW